MELKKDEEMKTLLWRKIFTGVSGTALAFLLATGVIHQQAVFSQENGTNTVQVNDPAKLTDEESKIVETVKTASEAVVSIGNMQKVSQYSGMSPFSGFQSHQYFMPDQKEKDLQLVAEGSGVIYKIEDGKAYIVTNHHVVDGADGLNVQLKNGQTVEGTLVGSDNLSDLAVLTIDASVATKALEFADSNKIQVGQTAIAIGSPMGKEFASSVTKGIISGVNRSVPVDTNGDHQADWDMNLLQTDAAINSGNSGGALINSAGQLIGINSSKLAKVGVEGMGFAIPSSDVVDIISQLESKGQVVRPALGISYTSLDVVHPDYRAQVMGLDEEDVNGAFITEVASGGAADKAGLKAYDLITAVDGQAVEKTNDLRKLLYQHQVGDTIKLKIRRGKEEMEVDVKLDSAISNEEANPLMSPEEEEETSPF
ncbi:S1C family serine protease [Facklamia hominis]